VTAKEQKAWSWGC